MNIVPDRTFISTTLYYLNVFRFLFLFWIFCRVMVYFLSFFLLILLIKYSAYLPDNPNYKRNYDDIKVAPANPFTESPKFYPRESK